MNHLADRVNVTERLRRAIDERLNEATGWVASPTLRSAVRNAVHGGKRVRPMITLLACSAAGGRDLDALDAAVAVEMLHSASLVHDDIMDESPLRRGSPTLHITAGLPTAILAGDTMIALAFRSLMRLDFPRRELVVALFTAGLLDLCDGQAEDLAGSVIDDMDIRSHRRMVERKTARLIEVAAGAGAIVGGGNEKAVRSLRAYGLSVGLAFQAMDDMLDAVGEEDVLGKPVRADRRNGRRTYLTLTGEDVESASAIADIIGEHTDAAVTSLRALAGSPARETLHTLAESLRHRTF